ncbi:MAG: hypothetical protein AAGJ91_02680 [Pseudomonadota bacterium]
MAFDNPTNAGRVEKMIEILGHIDKSAKSNRASQSVIATLLGPLWDELASVGVPVFDSPKTEETGGPALEIEFVDPSPKPQMPPRWSDIRAMIADADTDELLLALANIGDQLDKRIHDMRAA